MTCCWCLESKAPGLNVGWVSLREPELHFFCPFYCAVCDVGLQVGDGDIRGLWRIVGACLRGMGDRLCVKESEVLKKVSGTKWECDRVDVQNMAVRLV
jgi:hypothetical protein